MDRNSPGEFERQLSKRAHQFLSEATARPVPYITKNFPGVLAYHKGTFADLHVDSIFSLVGPTKPYNGS